MQTHILVPTRSSLQTHILQTHAGVVVVVVPTPLVTAVTDTPAESREQRESRGKEKRAYIEREEMKGEGENKGTRREADWLKQHNWETTAKLASR